MTGGTDREAHRARAGDSPSRPDGSPSGSPDPLGAPGGATEPFGPPGPNGSTEPSTEPLGSPDQAGPLEPPVAPDRSSSPDPSSPPEPSGALRPSGAFGTNEPADPAHPPGPDGRPGTTDQPGPSDTADRTKPTGPSDPMDPAGPAGSAAGVPGAAGAAASPEVPGRVPDGDAGKSDRMYLLAAVVVKPLMRTWFRIRLEGEDNIPAGGPVILASNHRSNMDPVLLASAVKRPVTFMAKAELFIGPLGWVLRWIGQFPVRRGGIDREALRRTEAVLARGSMLGLFPEGTRGDGRFSAVHPGLAYIMVRQRCPVLPVAIFGTERVRRRFGWLPFASPVRIVIGPPIELPQSTGDRAGRRAAGEVLQRRLQAFLASATGRPSANEEPNP
jgi:1-acyl-sn-glycerol-3-phosphate acyltransferase